MLNRKWSVVSLLLLKSRKIMKIIMTDGRDRNNQHWFIMYGVERNYLTRKGNLISYEWMAMLWPFEFNWIADPEKSLKYSPLMVPIFFHSMQLTVVACHERKREGDKKAISVIYCRPFEFSSIKIPCWQVDARLLFWRLLFLNGLGCCWKYAALYCTQKQIKSFQE